MGAALDAIRPGASENEVAGAAYAAFMAAGPTSSRAIPIVTSGWRSGVAHLTFGDRTPRARRHAPPRDERLPAPLLRPADARRRARPPVRDEVRRMADVIIEALNAAITAIRPGATSGDVDAACRGADRARRLRAVLPQAHRLFRGNRLRPRLGRGPHREPAPRRSRRRSSPAWCSTCRRRSASRGNTGWGSARRCWSPQTGCEVLTSFPRQLHVAAVDRDDPR